MFLGILILKKRYSLREYISIIMITAGIILATFASSKQPLKKDESINTESNEFVDFFWWTVGITMLTIALLLSAGMGLIQETLYKNHGKYPGQALYYNVSYHYF